MTDQVDLYSAYSHFTENVFEVIRKETFGRDIGQNSWLTTDEYDSFISWLGVAPEHHILEIATGSGGPASYLAEQVGCYVTGLDVNESGIATAMESAVKSKQTQRLSFRVADANKRLPFEDNLFDAAICIDAMNHFRDRLSVLQEWQRVLRSGSRALFTDPVVITGPVTNEELALRSSIGLFLFVPPGVNEQLIAKAGFHLLKQQDVTGNTAIISERWHQAREKYKDALLPIEGEERFEGLQKFFATVHRLSAERRLSRIVYLLEKPVR